MAKPHCPAKENSMTKVNWKFGEKENIWTKLEIIQSSEKKVEFKAYFTDKFGKKIFIMSYLLLKDR